LAERGLSGEWAIISRAGGEEVRAFVPRPLPPAPPLEVGVALQRALDLALVATGRLDSVTDVLPDPALFLYAYVRKEAVLSSQIEGTQSSLSDLLLFEIEEAPGAPLDDVAEVSSYVAALQHGLDRLREGFPLSNRLLREIHAVLLARGRGADKEPGAFRRSQNWIGGTRPGNALFVPPPPERVDECMSALERFLHDDPIHMPVLVKTALAHAQFETIHPFLDGNGRLGRLLITLLLQHERVLKEPILYLSLFFKKHRAQYYELLQRTRTHGDWESWIAFFADGVRETAESAVATARRLLDLFAADRARIEEQGRSSASPLQVHHALQRRPVATIRGLASATKLSVPTVTAALGVLEKLEIVAELTGRRRNRYFSYQRHLEILAEGTSV
jgi:Fic family protein